MANPVITITDKTAYIKVVLPDGTAEYFKKSSLNVWYKGNIVYLSDISKNGKFFSINYTYVSGAASATALVDTILGYDGNYTPPISIAGGLITNATVIAAIIADANWSTGDFVDPGSILTQITAGQYYYASNYYYVYTGSNLLRIEANTGK